MGATPTYALPYPEITDPADVPTDMAQLAVAVDTALGTVAGAGGGSPDLVTALPGSPANGDEVVLTNSLTAPAYMWALRYLAATGKWYGDGSFAFAAVETQETPPSHSAYVDCATVGPQFTLPVAGDYHFAWGAAIAGAPGERQQNTALKFGAAATSDADAAFGYAPIIGSYGRERVYTGLAAALLVKLQYKNVSPYTDFAVARRWLRVTPVKLG